MLADSMDLLHGRMQFKTMQQHQCVISDTFILAMSKTA